MVSLILLVYFQLFSEVETIFFESGDEKSAKCYVMSLEPSVILHNLLPLNVKYMLEVFLFWIPFTLVS